MVDLYVPHGFTPEVVCQIVGDVIDADTVFSVEDIAPLEED